MIQLLWNVTETDLKLWNCYTFFICLAKSVHSVKKLILSQALWLKPGMLTFDFKLSIFKIIVMQKAFKFFASLNKWKRNLIVEYKLMLISRNWKLNWKRKHMYSFNNFYYVPISCRILNYKYSVSGRSNNTNSQHFC